MTKVDVIESLDLISTTAVGTHNKAGRDRRRLESAKISIGSRHPVTGVIC